MDGYFSMEDEKTFAILRLARVCGIWGLIYLGMGIGFGMSEMILASVLKRLTPIAFLALGAFGFSLINYQISQWAKNKVGILDEEGRRKAINKLKGK